MKSIIGDGPIASLSRTERKKLRLQQRQQVIPYRPKLERMKSAGKWVGGGILAVLAAIATILFYFPEFSISLEAPLDPRDALSAPVVVRYTGWIPLMDVDLMCGIDKVTLSNGAPIEDVGIIQERYHQTVLWHDQAITAQCGVKDAAKAAVNFQIQYWPPGGQYISRSPWTVTRHYVSIRQSDGAARLEEEP